MANPWNLLRNTLPEPSVQVGTIQTNNGDGTSNVVLVGGGVIRASGTGFSSGQAVFVQGGQILSAAPALNIDLIEV